MSQHDSQLLKLCGDRGQTFQRAKELLHLANAKTLPGSGYALNELSTGLPAACALIASEELKNQVVDFPTAQGNSCLKKQDFARCLKQVRAALDASNLDDRPRTRSQPGPRISYDSLAFKYDLPKKYGVRFPAWCWQAEAALLELPEVKNTPRDNPEVKLAAFYWVCEALKLDLHDDLASFANANSAGSASKSRSFYFKLEDCCSGTREAIFKESQRPSDAPRIRLPSYKLSEKRTLRELPSKDSPKKRKLSSEHQAENLTPAFVGVFPPERSVSAARETHANTARVVEVDMLPPETPSKTRHDTSSSSSRNAFVSSRTPTQSNSRHHERPPFAVSSPAEEPMDVDSFVDGDDDEPSDQTRFRPVFLDRKQWTALDPNIVKMRKLIGKLEKRREKIVHV
ncbi:hypothetical protein GYMLUDRAFT_255048 [Collybiopsis luxurians FD-317 M1]|nr:hypothetical protein GYMLUDRAFT_255048 [Collybiopsis luxurians FD-317 M1]